MFGVLVLAGTPMGGFDIWRVTGIGVGRVYIALERLEQAGLVIAEWETLAEGERRPRRRLYRPATVTVQEEV